MVNNIFIMLSQVRGIGTELPIMRAPQPGTQWSPSSIELRDTGSNASRMRRECIRNCVVSVGNAFRLSDNILQRPIVISSAALYLLNETAYLQSTGLGFGSWMDSSAYGNNNDVQLEEKASKARWELFHCIDDEVWGSVMISYVWIAGCY